VNALIKTLPLLALLLSGCTADLEELQQWTEAERRAARPSVRPLQPPSKFEPQAYEVAAGIEPFSPQKLSVGAKQEAAQPNSALAAEMSRRREPLEAFPLDSMAMVGSMSRKDGRYAVLKVDNLLYYVKPGNYLGQNFGRILKIDETELTLREIVQDASGEWVERITTLQLQEAAR
jgi:type IV pilus assembly protein PilP